MLTVDQVIGKLRSGKLPESLWLRPDRSLELRFLDGEIVVLADAAIGNEAFNQHLNGCVAENAALAKLIDRCRWLPEDDAHELVREYVCVDGCLSCIYPFDLA